MSDKYSDAVAHRLCSRMAMQKVCGNSILLASGTHPGGDYAYTPEIGNHKRSFIWTRLQHLLLCLFIAPTLNYGQEPVVYSQNNKIFLALIEADCISPADSLNYIVFSPQWSFVGDTLKTLLFFYPFSYRYQSFIIENEKFKLIDTINIDAQWPNKREEDINSMWMGSWGIIYIFFRDGTFTSLSYSAHVRAFASCSKDNSRKP